MPRMTNEQVQAHLAKMATIGENPDLEPDEGPESSIQNKIVAWAKVRGYPCLSIMPRRPIRGEITPGWPDVTLAIKGKVIFIELKSANGALRNRQKLIRGQLNALGHEWYQVKSYKAFLEVVNNAK